jgi:carboxyl-terminal processing protease
MKNDPKVYRKGNRPTMSRPSVKKWGFWLSAVLLGSVLTIGVLYGLQAFDLLSPPEFRKLHAFYRTLEKHYVEPIDSRKLIDGAINGMLETLDDPYTTYMNEEQSEQFFEQINNEFEGIGAEVREVDGQTMIVAPIKDSPAEKAGLKPNDIILKANGIDLNGLSIQESVKHLRGPKGTEVTLLIRRPGLETPFEVKIVRDEIPLQSVFVHSVEDGAAVIQISRFSQTTVDEFDKALKEVQAKGAKGLIIDLRQNPGGLLNAVFAISEKFVPKGKLVVQVKYRDGSIREYRSQADPLDLPVVLLVDQGSASASEIMAGALKESAGVPLVGVTTFGKGTVQTTLPYPDGTSLKFTTAQWLTPEGHHIHKQGVAPDIEVKLPDYAELPYLYVEETFDPGDRSEVIATAQKYLQALGYDPGRTDGLLDPAAANALRAFQTSAGVEPTGRLDGETAVRLVEALRKLIQANDTQLAKAKEVLAERIKAADDAG